MTFPSSSRWLCGASIAASAIGAAAPAGAAPCRVEVTRTPSPEWQRATEALEASNLTDADCTSIVVTISEHGARLTYVTPDGRRAERELTDPDELRATVDALRVRGPAPKQGAVPKSPSPANDARKETLPSQAPPSTQGTSVIFALGVGVRAGADLASPVLNGSVSLAFRRWELGLNAASELHYGVIGGEPVGPLERNGNAFSVGLSAGRREPVGGLALLAGVRTSLGWLVFDQEGPAMQPADDREMEWRLGGYLGLAVPRRSTVRFRADLGADFVAANRPPDTYAMTPAWAMTALIGAEIGGS